MNRIEVAFSKGKAFIPFITGGDPNVETTEKIILALEECGADIIEIGIPFSDPIAEGPVIQAASERALLAGTTVDTLFAMVQRLRLKTSVPLVFMTYFNPIFVYGKEKFLQNCQECGVDGIIVPDMPFEEKEELQQVCRQYGVALISLIAPTSEERAAEIAKNAEGFLYCVSSMGVTGMRSQISNKIGDVIRIAKASSSIPCAIGFGVSTPEQAQNMAQLADGVIVGSAIVKVIAEHGENCIPAVQQLVTELTEFKRQ